MKIGSTFNPNKDKTLTISQLLLVDPKLMVINLTIEEKEYKVDLRDIIQFDKKTDELSELDIDTQIEKITSYRFTIMKCISELQSKINLHSRKFKNWYSSHFINRHRELNISIVSKKVSDKYVEHSLLGDHLIFPDYEEKTSIIEEATNQKSFLSMIDVLLSQRLEALRSIGRRRLNLKGGKYESGY